MFNTEQRSKTTLSTSAKEHKQPFPKGLWNLFLFQVTSHIFWWGHSQWQWKQYLQCWDIAEENIFGAFLDPARKSQGNISFLLGALSPRSPCTMLQVLSSVSWFRAPFQEDLEVLFLSIPVCVSVQGGVCDSAESFLQHREQCAIKHSSTIVASLAGGRIVRSPLTSVSSSFSNLAPKKRLKSNWGLTDVNSSGTRTTHFSTGSRSRSPSTTTSQASENIEKLFWENKFYFPDLDSWFVWLTLTSICREKGVVQSVDTAPPVVVHGDVPRHLGSMRHPVQQIPLPRLLREWIRHRSRSYSGSFVARWSTFKFWSPSLTDVCFPEKRLLPCVPHSSLGTPPGQWLSASSCRKMKW